MVGVATAPPEVNVAASECFRTRVELSCGVSSSPKGSSATWQRGIITALDASRHSCSSFLRCRRCHRGRCRCCHRGRCRPRSLAVSSCVYACAYVRMCVSASSSICSHLFSCETPLAAVEKILPSCSSSLPIKVLVVGFKTVLQAACYIRKARQRTRAFIIS